MKRIKYLFLQSRLSHFICVTACLSFCASLNAQVIDTAVVQKDSTATVQIAHVPFHSPKKAALMSAALPGLGQIYNKKYWKVPVIYAGLGALVYAFQFNQSRYVKYRDALKYRLDDDVSTVDQYTGIYSDSDLEQQYHYYHRYRDLSAIGIAAVYLLNVVDASVDAHLFRFDVSDDLSLRVRPSILDCTALHAMGGISLKIKF